MTAWLAIGGAGLVAYVMQLVPPLLHTRHDMPAQIAEVSRLVAPAVIAALLASSLVTNAHGGFPARNIAVLIVGMVVARRTRSIPYTVASGVLVYAAIGAFL
jgi:branched-subunit amino acid transport protein